MDLTCSSETFSRTKKPLPKTVVVDGPPLKIGSHADNFKKIHKKTFAKSGKIFASEQRKFLIPENLLKCIIKNPFVREKIKSIKLGLGEEKTILKASGEGDAFSLISEDDSNAEKIEITTIDDYVAENNLDVGLIKLDVEGFELETLKSAVNTLKKSKPILLLSIYHTPKDFFGIKPFLESLDVDYNFMVRKLINHYSTFEMTLICY